MLGHFDLRGGGLTPSYYQCRNHREVKRNYPFINQRFICKFTLEYYHNINYVFNEKYTLFLGSNTLSSLPQNRKNGFHYHRPPFCLQPVRFISIPYSRRIILIGSVFLSFKYIFTIKCDYRIQRHNRINLLHDIIFDANLPARVSAALIPWFDGFDNGFPLILQLLLLHCIVTRSPLRFP